MRPLAIQKGLGSTYSKPLRIRAVNLPEGVSFSASTFSQNDSTIPVWFKAEKDAAITAQTFELVVEPVEANDRKTFRGGFAQVLPATNRRGDYAMYFDKTRKAAVAVCDYESFNIAIEPPATPLVQKGQIELTVKVDRTRGFDKAIYCEMDWLPSGVGRQPPLIIPPNQTTATYTLSASPAARPGTVPISITARENEGGNPRTGAGFHYISSAPVPLTIAEPYMELTLNRTAIERGKTGMIQADVKVIKKFDGNAILRLGRLPFGVRQLKPYPQLSASGTKAEFRVEVSSDCLTGIYKDIFCDISIKDNGQLIRQQTGNGVLRVDQERD